MSTADSLTTSAWVHLIVRTTELRQVQKSSSQRPTVMCNYVGMLHAQLIMWLAHGF